MPGATSRKLRRQIVLNENGSVRWKIVPEGTPEVPAMHQSDVRCTLGSWPYIVVGHDMGPRRWVRRRPGGWAFEDATKPLGSSHHLIWRWTAIGHGPCLPSVGTEVQGPRSWAGVGHC